MGDVVVVLQELLDSKRPPPVAAAANAPPPEAARAVLGNDADAYHASAPWAPVLQQFAGGLSPAALAMISRVKLTNVFLLPAPDGIFTSVGALDSLGSSAAGGGGRGAWDSGGGAVAAAADGHGTMALRNTLDAAPELGRGGAATGSVTDETSDDDFVDVLEDLKADESFFPCASRTLSSVRVPQQVVNRSVGI